MNNETDVIHSSSNKITLNELFHKYKSSYKSAFLDLSIHTFFLSSSFYLMWFFKNSWVSIFTVPLLSLLNIKTFIIFHDCGHHSYTPNKILNSVIGIITGIITITPFCWNFSHNTHHLTSGNINNIYDYPYNETIFHSLQEYKKFSFPKRQIYKFLKHPLFFFTIVPIFKFLVILRFNAIILLTSKLSIKNIKNINTIIIIDQIINNIGIYFLYYFMYQYSVLYHYLITGIINTSIGIILFHSQHGFNPPYIVNNETYNQKDSGLKGSSFVEIPYLFKYFTGGVEYHDIHHMNSKIPNYNLQLYHEEAILKSNLLDNIIKLSMLDCYNNLWLGLYDEDTNKFITFEEAEHFLEKSVSKKHFLEKSVSKKHFLEKSVSKK